MDEMNFKDSFKEDRQSFKENMKTLKFYQNYIIIVILSIIAVFFLPMLGSSGDLCFKVPSTFAGWIVWLASKFSIIILNVMLFSQFIKQAKINVRDDPRFLEAERLLSEIGYLDKEIYYHPLIYIEAMTKKKKISLLITSAISIFGLTNAILTFDWVTLLTYLFTVSIALIFGWISMADTEDIWTITYLKFAKQEYNKNIIQQTEEENPND